MKFELHFAIIILAALFESADCFKINVNNASFPATGESRPLSADIISSLLLLNQGLPLQVRIIFDKVYEETVNSAAELLASETYGVRIFENDNAVAKLKVLLQLGSGNTALLVFCSVVNVINMFQLIRTHRLRSDVVHWMLFLESSESEQDLRKNLEELLFEGTRISVLEMISPGVLRISTARVGSDGIFRFRSGGRVDLVNTDRDRLQDRVSLLATSKGDDYSDLEGREMVVAANDIWPFFRFRKVTPKGVEISEAGIDVMLLRTLGDVMNFTYRVVSPADRQWGQPQPDGTVTGLIGLVARREAHLSLSCIAITSSRKTVVDYTMHYYKEPLGIFSRAPKQKNRALAILAPFTPKVWMALFAATVIIGPLIFVLARASSSDSEDYMKTGLQDHAFNAFRSLVTQGYRLPADLGSHRILLAFWFLFCLNVWALYSGMLMAVLAVPAYESPIDSLEDLPRAVGDGYILGVMKESSNEYLFRKAKEGIYKRTWELFNHGDMSESYVRDPSVGIRKVLATKFVYIGPQSLTEILAISLGRRNFHFARGTFYPQLVGIVCPFGAPYNAWFTGLILRMTEGGLILKWKEDEIRTIPQMSSGGDNESASLAITLRHLQAAFLIILIGYSVSTLFLILEIITDRCSTPLHFFRFFAPLFA